MVSGRYGFTNQAWLQLLDLPEGAAQLVKETAQALPAWVDVTGTEPHDYDQFEKPFYRARIDWGESSIELEFHLQISRMSPKRAVIRNIAVIR